MQRAQPVSEEVDVTGIAKGGDGIARLGDGRVVFCEGALPGERVGITISEMRRDFARARVVDVVVPSAARRAPPCPHLARGCGGCTWQHVRPEHQLILKSDIVRDALRRIAHLGDVPVSTGAGVREVAYRTNVRLSVDDAGRPAYRKHRSHDELAVDSCLVAHPLLAELIVDGRFPGATEVGLRVGARSGERMAWADGRVTPVLPPGTRFGADAAIDELVWGRRWRISAGAFFQSGPDAAEILAASVLRAAGEVRGTVVDLYAGGGLLGGSIAAAGGVDRLVAVESNRAAVADARINLAEYGAEVVALDVASFAGDPADLVVADPARSGLGPAGARAASRLGASTLVLVSCDPASLARDAILLAGFGYALDTVEVLDLFPDTFHVETVSRFGKIEDRR
jgi:23S rRNA (uracil1939-C5)-methyltransferase